MGIQSPLPSLRGHLLPSLLVSQYLSPSVLHPITSWLFRKTQWFPHFRRSPTGCGRTLSVATPRARLQPYALFPPHPLRAILPWC